MGATRSDTTPNVLAFQDVRSKHTINQSAAQTSKPIAPVSSQLSPAFALEIQNWAATLPARFVELQDHPERVAMAGKLFVRSIKPRSRKPGRPQHTEITRASELVDSGISWNQIPQLVIEGFDKMEKWQQEASKERLVHSTWTRRAADRRKRIQKSKICF